MAEPGPEDSREQRRAGQVEVAKAGILAAAAKVFLRDGYQRATMRGIAREAGYTASSLYTYFPSKEALFRALRDSLEQRGYEIFEGPMPSGLDFAQRLEMVTLRILELSREMKEALLLYVVADAQLPDETLAERLAYRKAFNHRIGAWVAGAASEAELGGHDPVDVAVTFFGLVEAQLCRALEGGELDPDRLARGLDLARDFTLRILSAPPVLRT